MVIKAAAQISCPFFLFFTGVMLIFSIPAKSQVIGANIIYVNDEMSKALINTDRVRHIFIFVNYENDSYVEYKNIGDTLYSTGANSVAYIYDKEGQIVNATNSETVLFTDVIMEHELKIAPVSNVSDSVETRITRSDKSSVYFDTFFEDSVELSASRFTITKSADTIIDTLFLAQNIKHQMPSEIFTVNCYVHQNRTGRIYSGNILLHFYNDYDRYSRRIIYIRRFRK